MKLNIKPLSVNEAYNGRRFKTKKYKAYKQSLMLILPKINIPDGMLSINITWGFSSAGSDIDNPCKPFIDCLQAKYDFNDNRVSLLHLERVKVKKGDEFIDFSIVSYQ
jgi:Holliday junction resolvase RusA-like endonuclease